MQFHDQPEEEAGAVFGSAPEMEYQRNFLWDSSSTFKKGHFSHTHILHKRKDDENGNGERRQMLHIECKSRVQTVLQDDVLAESPIAQHMYI